MLFRSAIGTDAPTLTLPRVRKIDAGRKFFCRITTDKGTFTSRTAQLRSPLTALAVHLNFDDGTAADSSGNGNHGVLFGGVTAVNDPVRGGVLRFDGAAGSYIRIAQSDSLNTISGAITIAMWLNTNTTAVRQLIEKGGTGGAAWYTPPWGIRMEADRSLRLNWGNNVPPALYSSPLVLNTWTHVAMVYDSSQASNQRMFYINGALDALSDWTTVPTTNSNDLFIGTDFYNSTSRWAYLGMMDDVRIYAEALTKIGRASCRERV